MRQFHVKLTIFLFGQSALLDTQPLSRKALREQFKQFKTVHMHRFELREFCLSIFPQKSKYCFRFLT